MPVRRRGDVFGSLRIVGLFAEHVDVAPLAVRADEGGLP